MGFSVTKDGPYFTSGPISFSQLRSTFEGPGGAVRLSDYKRDTNVFNSNPRVPDATENSSISSSNSNIRLSTFRGVIKVYRVEQSGTDLNADFGLQNWNGNLAKNVPKRAIVQGDCGSNTIGAYAAGIFGTMYNLRFVVNGRVLGASGAGGVVSSTGLNAGQPGGPALFVSSLGTSVIVVPRGPIYGGGGGGAKGINGNPGAPGTCFYYSYYYTGNSCGSCPGCGGNASVGCYPNGGCNCSKKGCSSTNYYSQCRVTNYYSVPGAPGGVGGNGGRGTGYNYNAPGALGLAGAPGTPGGCPNYGAPGDPGQTGGTGGNWGNAGETVYRYGRFVSGGPAGRGISGSNYTVDNGTYGGSISLVLGGY